MIQNDDRYGRIDVLINNAGFGFQGSVESTPPAVVREIFDLNFEAALLACQLAIPIMRKQGSGHIINVSSIVGRRGLPLSGIYCATKFALNGISEALRIELKDSNIDVSIVSPAATETEFGDQVRQGDVNVKFKAIGHVQTSEEVAAAIVRCIKIPKIEVFPNRTSRLLAWANALAPSLVDKIMMPFFPHAGCEALSTVKSEARRHRRRRLGRAHLRLCTEAPGNRIAGVSRRPQVRADATPRHPSCSRRICS